MAKFCGTCGARLDQATGRCPRCGKKKSGKFWLAAAVIAAVLLAGGVFALHRMADRTNASEPAPDITEETFAAVGQAAAETESEAQQEATIRPGIYLAPDNDKNMLYIRQQGSELLFSVWWLNSEDDFNLYPNAYPDCGVIHMASARLKGNAARFDLRNEATGQSAAGEILFEDGRAVLTVERSENPHIPYRTTVFSWVRGDLTEEELRETAAELRVPEDLDVEYVLGTPCYWVGGGIYRSYFEVYYNGEMVAGSSVDPFSGGGIGSIWTFDESHLPEEPAETATVSGTMLTLEVLDMSPWRDPVEEVTASSSYGSDRVSHDAENLLDDDPGTNWTEDAEGYGIGESVLFVFKDVCQLNAIHIRGGNQYDYDRYKDNGRPEWITLSFSDGSAQQVRLKDVLKEQTLTLSRPVRTDSVEITIHTVYEGRRYEDTVISDVSFDAFALRGETKSVPTSAQRCTRITHATYYDDSGEYAVITGCRADGSRLWEYESSADQPGQFPGVPSMEVYGDTYYFVEHGTLIAFDIDKGGIRWKNEDFGGFPSAWTFDDEGTLYLCGYLSPDLFVADRYGKTIHKVFTFDENYYWPSSIVLQDGKALINMDGYPLDLKTREHVITVDLKDYSCQLPGA